MREITIQVVLRLRAAEDSAAPRYCLEAITRCARGQLAFRDETVSAAILMDREVGEVES